MTHRRWLYGTALAAIALLIAACGGNDEQPAAATANATVSVAQVDGVGSVLVDRDGAALYTPDEESGDRIRCRGDCASIWLPLATSSTPTGSEVMTSRLGTVERPDGTRQVTYDGKPLYRFAEDAQPGQVSGDGVSDRFGGTAFTWHVVKTGGASSGGGSGRDYSY